MSADLGRDELFRLLGGLSQETLTAEEHGRLQEMLAASAEARRLWFLHCDMERGLARWAIARRDGADSMPTIPPFASPPARRSLNRPGTWAMAACFVFAVLGGAAVLISRASASPTALLQRALKVHAAALDRCYRVEGKSEAALRGMRLWTRGDRFCIERRAGERTLAWGRDEQGRVWFTASPETGASFEADEVPERLAAVSELRTLQPDTLLRSMLADFELRREADAAGNQVVHAQLKPGHQRPRYSAALLEIDSASGVLRRMEVQRTVAGRAVAPVTLTLEESGLQDDARYTLAGHLSDHATIYDRNFAPAQRKQALAEFLDLLVGHPRDKSPPVINR